MVLNYYYSRLHHDLKQSFLSYDLNLISSLGKAISTGKVHLMFLNQCYFRNKYDIYIFCRCSASGMHKFETTTSRRHEIKGMEQIYYETA